MHMCACVSINKIHIFFFLQRNRIFFNDALQFKKEYKQTQHNYEFYLEIKNKKCMIHFL